MRWDTRGSQTDLRPTAVANEAGFAKVGGNRAWRQVRHGRGDHCLGRCDRGRRGAGADSDWRARAEGRAHAHAVADSADESQSGESTDVLQPITSVLDGANDPYLALKSELQNDANFQFAMPVSVFGQWGAPNGGPGVAELVYTPLAAWTPFTNTAIGSGAFNFLFQSNAFWTGANTFSQLGSMGLLTPPNDWFADGYHFQRLTYTHTFPGNVLAVSVGQYSFAQFDGNPYAGNPQTNFINFALAQNGTQAYAAAGTGAYAQITPSSQLQFGRRIPGRYRSSQPAPDDVRPGEGQDRLFFDCAVDIDNSGRRLLQHPLL